MNSRTCKLLNCFARLSSQSRRTVKRAWQRLPWRQRCAARKAFQAEVESLR